MKQKLLSIENRRKNTIFYDAYPYRNINSSRISFLGKKHQTLGCFSPFGLELDNEICGVEFLQALWRLTAGAGFCHPGFLFTLAGIVENQWFTIHCKARPVSTGFVIYRIFTISKWSIITLGEIS